VFWLNLHCLISGFRRKQMITAFFWVVTQLVMVISYRRFAKNYGSYLQESNIFCLCSWSLRVVTICSTETYVRNYHHLLHNNQNFRGFLLTLHYYFVVQFYLITIQYLASIKVLKHFITQFYSGFCRFVIFSSRRFFSTPLSSDTPKMYYSFSMSDQIFHRTKANGRITVCNTLLHL